MNTKQVSDIFDPTAWREVEGFSFNDITYHRALAHGTVRIAFNRPEVRNAFRPATVDELFVALDHARQSTDVGCVLLTGNGPSPKDGGWAFCSGGDQRIRGKDGVELVDMCSEDVAFCKNIEDAGFDIMLNTRLRVGHEKSVVL